MISRWIAKVTFAAIVVLVAPFVPVGSQTAAAQQACLTERAPAGARVLVFSRTAGFRHGSIPSGIAAVQALGQKYGFAVETTEDPAQFNDDRLRGFGAIVFMSTTGDVLDPTQQAAFQRYIRGGGGYVGIHAAADTEHDWEWYGQLVGAYFKRHPTPQQATINVLNPASHISTRCVPQQWTRFDEWYDYTARPAANVTILANLDEASYMGGQMGNPHPIAWYHEFEGGRAWYTGLGHPNEAFAEPALLDHIAGGILWALRRPAPAAAAPTGPAQRPATATADFSPKPAIVPGSVAEEQSRFVLQPGYRLEPVLTEPNILEPTQIAFDGNGRMFVLEMRSYMQDADGTNELTPTSRISLHDDKDGDGVYETHTVYVDNLVLPRFVMPFGRNSILTAESNEDEVWLYTDRNDDGVADSKVLFANNFGRVANIEHQPANMTWAMDNWLYTTFNSYRQRWTPNGVLREGTGTPGGAWGVTQDNFGKTYIQEGATGLPAYTQFPIRYGDFQWTQRFQQGLERPYSLTGMADYQPGPQASFPDGKLNRVTGGAGNDIIRGHRLPADLLGDYVHGEPVARVVRRFNIVNMQGLDQFQQVHQDQQEEFIRSTDPLFRPVQQETAPDGTLYIVDMYRGIIQEGNWTQPGSYLRQKVEQYSMQNITKHGRIWRLTYDGIPRDTERPRMNDETPAELVRHLEHPNGWWRDTAQRLLILYRDRSVVPALEAMARTSTNEVARYHAMWTLEGLGALTPALVRELMADPSPQMRIQAIRASESLYKDGDLSFAADYRKATTDADTDVVIQGLLTLQYFQVPDMGEIARSVSGARQETGIAFVAGRILERLDRPAAIGGAGLTEAETTLLRRGKEIYDATCTSCRDVGPRATPTAQMPDGWLLATSLSGNSYVTGHRDYVIKALLHGVSGARQMPALRSRDDETIAALASYIRFMFSNQAPPVTAADVAAVRAATESRTTAWTQNELVASLPLTLTPDRSWKVTASHASRMVVGSVNDPFSAFNYEGWSNGVPQAEGQWFQIELPEAVTLSEIEFQAPIEGGVGGRARQRAAPIRLRVEVSMDGTNPTTVAEETPDDSQTQILSFAPVRARFIRLTQVGAATEAAPRWTMRRMKLVATR